MLVVQCKNIISCTNNKSESFKTKVFGLVCRCYVSVLYYPFLLYRRDCSVIFCRILCCLEYRRYCIPTTSSNIQRLSVIELSRFCSNTLMHSDSESVGGEVANVSHGAIDDPNSNSGVQDMKQIGYGIFRKMSESEQLEFLQDVLDSLNQQQLRKAQEIFSSLLQKDFISLLPAIGLEDIAEEILAYLDYKSLCAAERVSRQWKELISYSKLWRKQVERKVKTDKMWHGLLERRGWMHITIQTLAENPLLTSEFYRKLYPSIYNHIKALKQNWIDGDPTFKIINCNTNGESKGVYCLQYDNSKIISGHRDNTIKIWDAKSLECKQILTGHTGSILSLQFDGNILVTGSSDSTVRIWDLHAGTMVTALNYHHEPVLHVRFIGAVLISSSKDQKIAVWSINRQAMAASLQTVLIGHRAAVNAVEFDENYIVSASGDRTIKVWSAKTCEFIRTLKGHNRGVACIHYRGTLIVSGSSDNTIRLWDIDSGVCLRVLEGHNELVRCIRFDETRIVSGAYDGRIKVWDLQAALNPRISSKVLCLRTLWRHTGRVFRLEFDDFQIMSSSHDDLIIIWDFDEQGNPLEAVHQAVEVVEDLDDKMIC